MRAIPPGTRFSFVLFLATSVILTLGCEGLGGLRSLQAGLQEAFAAERVELSRSETSLEVKLITSPANELSDKDREGRAREVAAFVRDRYSEYNTLAVIRIELVQEIRVGLMSGAKSASFSFETSDLGTSQAPPMEESPSP